MRSKVMTDVPAPRSLRGMQAGESDHGLVPRPSAPEPMRGAPVGATGVRAGHLARHRRPIAPVSVGRSMPAGPRGPAQAAPEALAGDALPGFLRLVSSAATAA